jgi:hypothetical protein
MTNVQPNQESVLLKLDIYNMYIHTDRVRGKRLRLASCLLIETASFDAVAPEPLEIVAEYFVLRVLENAFQRIAAESATPPSKCDRFRLVSNPDGPFEDELEIAGVVKLHQFKIAYIVIKGYKA